MKKYTYILILPAVLFVTDLFAQFPSYYRQEKNNQGRLITVNFLYGGHQPGGDFGDLFGNHFSAGLGTDYILSNNWIIGFQGHYLFGNKVKQDILDPLRNEDGLIFGTDGGIAEVQLRLRGIYLGGHVGRIFPLKEGSRSGIRVTAGAGFFQHKVRIQDDPIVDTPQFSKDYKKGYDRLTNGLGITEFIGYQHLGKERRVNFIAGFEFTQAFTQNRRNFNFDTRESDDEPKLDLSFGFRVGWLLPLYIGENADEIQY